MIRGGVALLALVLVSCSSTSTATVTPRPSPSPSLPPSPIITVLPSSSPSGTDLPLSTVGFNCHLPVMVETTGSQPVSFQGGFLLLPSATFGPDGGGVITSTGAGAVLTTRQTPVLYGAPQAGLPSYDVGQRRWLPVGAPQTSSDGAIYAYSTIGQKSIQVVSVATGTVRTFNANVTAPGSIGLAVEDVEGSSVYFAAAFPDGPASGVWRLDLSSGVVTQVIQLANVFAVRDGAAWAGYQDPNDPNPPKADSGIPLFDSLVRVDLATGQHTTWDYRPGKSLSVAVVEAGKVVVHIFDPSSAGDELRLLSGPVSGGEENGELIYFGPMSFDVPRIDANGVWLGNDRGVYLYTSSAGLQKVYAMSPSPGVSLFPAGSCF